MKLGLIRHHKVNHAYPKKFLISADELRAWFEAYEKAGIEYGHSETGAIKWKTCYSSPLPRALSTAKSLYNGEIIVSEEISELNVLPLIRQKLKLPLVVWALIMKSKAESENEITLEFNMRISAFLDKVLSEHNEDVLIVSHGFVMMRLRKELKRRGFRGPYFSSPLNAKLYVFEN